MKRVEMFHAGVQGATCARSVSDLSPVTAGVERERQNVHSAIKINVN